MFRYLFFMMFLWAMAVAQTKTEIKQVPPKPTNPASGKEMFEQYCAACHGPDGKGTGPAAKALKSPLPDLTTLSARHGGKYPEIKVYNAIQGDMLVDAHGTKDMPVWGTVLRSLSRDDATVKMRINNLTNYVRSLQK